MQVVIGLGIKVAWTAEELARAQAAALRPPAWFTSREEAAARYLRISGLAGLLEAADPAVDAGLREQHGRWRLAMDRGAFAVGAPDMTQLLARSQATVVLARGTLRLAGRCGDVLAAHQSVFPGMMTWAGGGSA